MLESRCGCRMELYLLPMTLAASGAAVLSACLLACSAGPVSSSAGAPVAAADSADGAPKADAAGSTATSEASPGRDSPSATNADTQAEPRQQSEPKTQGQGGEPPPAVAPVPEGSTVVHIGDSMAGALGIELNRALKRAGVKGILHFKTASFIPDWAWGRDIALYMAQHNPDLVLISLGANEVAIKDPTIRIKQVQRLVQRLQGRPCVWIAPPLWAAGDTGLLPVIRAHCAPCRFMDTNALVKDMPRLRDKIHPTMPARKVWAEYVVKWLARQRDPRADRPWELLPVDPDNQQPHQPPLQFPTE